MRDQKSRLRDIIRRSLVNEPILSRRTGFAFRTKLAFIGPRIGRDSCIASIPVEPIFNGFVTPAIEFFHSRTPLFSRRRFLVRFLRILRGIVNCNFERNFDTKINIGVSREQDWFWTNDIHLETRSLKGTSFKINEQE